MNKRIPTENTSTTVAFLLRGAQKRRAMAMARAQVVQREVGILPRLVSVK